MDITPEKRYLDRRAFLKRVGLASAGMGLSSILAACKLASSQEDGPFPPSVLSGWEEPHADLHPAPRSEVWDAEGLSVTDRDVVGRYNNFYEFTTVKDRVWQMVDRFETRPWEVEISGPCANPGVYDLDDLARLAPLEERVHRLRCVEAWSAVIPWSGYPLARLIEHVEPRSDVSHVRFVSFMRPGQAPEQSNDYFPWPYYEALTIEEATHDLTLLAFGVYGRPLVKQHGAPVRLVVPWKYGFKSIKSIVSIELRTEPAPTFWNDLAPDEYGVEANVNPEVPHPRWSQATERDIGTGERRPTVLYNGYGEQVAHLYE